MLDYSEVREHKYIIHDEEPWEVLSSHVFRMQMRKPVNQTKLRNLISGRVVEITFHQNDKIREADIGEREIKYLYSHRGEHWFCDPEDPADRFKLSEDIVGSFIQYMKPNTVLQGSTFNEELIGIKPPIKVDLKVKESAPAVKGNTAQGAMKEAILETGAKVMVPLFINEGDVVRVNTEKGEYTERVEKA